MQVFVSYSHRDERFLQELEKHLAILKRKGLIELWYDRAIPPGGDLHREIDTNLDQASIVLLLVSPDFIASDYCYAKEVEHALSLHKMGKARVVPIIVRPVDWSGAPFADLKALPKDGKPVSSWKNRDEAFLDVARGIRAVVEELGAQPTSLPQPISSHPLVFDYQGEIVQVGGVGSRLVTKTAWLITEHGYINANEYVTHYFNGAGDVMWASCPPEFRIVGATSPTGNVVFAMVEGDKDTPYGLRIKDQMQNSIAITCERKMEELPRVTGTVCSQCYAPKGPFQKYCSQCGSYAT